MDWTYLGHAMWHIEAGGLRLLCDPLLERTHHCGVFEVIPHREIDVEALRPDFIFVSHRHPDHFDVASLHRLAQLDPNTVVVTPDPRIVAAATRLGFRGVQQIAPGTLVELDGVRVVTTPSVDPGEWGVMIGCDGAAAWNQVDTVFTGPEHAVAVRDAALAAIGAERVAFAAVRWQPMLEIAAQLGSSTHFPLRAYDQVLQQIAAVEPGSVVPAAAGGSHVGAWAWLDRVVFPVPESRLLRDLATMCPHTALFASQVGATWRIDAHGVAPIVGAPLARVLAGPDPRRFSPLQIPALVDPNPSAGHVPTMRAVVREWIAHELCPGLRRAWTSLGSTRPLALAVELVWPEHTETMTIALDHDGVTVRDGDDDDWDALNQVAGSLLWEVVAGRRGWGDVLLAGALRARSRAYRVDAQGAHALNLAEIFLYYGLDYDASHDRATAWEIDRVLRRSDRPLVAGLDQVHEGLA